MTSHTSIKNLIHVIQDFILRDQAKIDHSDLVTNQLQLILNCGKKADGYQAHLPSHLQQPLISSIHNIQANPRLAKIGAALDKSYGLLNWQIDDGDYYLGDADVGDGYRFNNMHCELIGPDPECYWYAKNFRFGLFLLGPNVLYRDHNHPAPEFYLNLTEPISWRFNRGPWVQYEAGSTIWNKSNAVHATLVHDQPFLSIYSWTENVHELCQVIHADDWSKYES